MTTQQQSTDPLAMDRGMLFWVLVMNVVAVAVLWGRVADTDLGIKLRSHVEALAKSLLPPADERPAEVCGFVKWDSYTIVSKRVVLPAGVHPAAVHISKGKIVKVDGNVGIKGTSVLDFGNAVLSPGVIDVHVHLNEPGRAEWEGIATGTTAAAVGGTTSVIDMPLNSFPVTTTESRLTEKQGLAKVKAVVNVGHWAGLTPENAAQHDVLSSLVAAGALGFKSFMSPSGIDDFPNVGAADIAAALPFLKAAGVPFYVHAEWVSDVPEHEGQPTEYATYQASRPPSFEQDAVRLLVKLLDEDDSEAAPGFSVHIAHLADAECLPIIKEAQSRGHPITVETCAHYLAFSSDDIADGQTLFKCAPPIRDEANRQALVAAVLDGSINFVSSDHSPAPPELKHVETGNFLKAWGGISGVQYLLPATWTSLKAAGGDLAILAKVLSSQPAKLAGLQDRKGKIAEGFDADIVVWDPEQDADTTQEGNMHRHKLSPYSGKHLKGKVLATIVNGRMVNRNGEVGEKTPCGAEVLRRR